MDFDVVREYIKNSSPESEIYVGCDSQIHSSRKKGVRPSVTYAIVVVIHNIEDGIGQGCKLFKKVIKEKLHYDIAMRQRLMQEVYYSGEAALEIVDTVGDRTFSIHIDVSNAAKNKSNLVMNEAMGYVRGLGIVPTIKPNACAASAAADKYANAVK